MLFGIVALLCWLALDKVKATSGAKVISVNVPGIVTDTQGRPIIGATVYFINSVLVDTSLVTPTRVLAGAAESTLAPLESLVNNAAIASTLPKAKTNKQGRFKVAKLNTQETYFPFVVPASTDANHLPGGDLSRIAFSPNALGKAGLAIQISWQAPSTAAYIGSTACYGCHTDLVTNKQHAHSLAIRTPGQFSANQDPSFHSNCVDYTNMFKQAATYTGGKALYYQNYDPTQTQNFDVLETQAPGPVYLIVYLWIDSNNNYNVTLVNPNNPSDPLSPLTLKVGYTKGGQIGKQELCLELPGRKGRYAAFPFAGFLPIPNISGSDQGLDNYYDRTRHPYQDSLKTFLSAGADKVYGTADDLLVLPPVTSTFEASCAACHFTGYKNFTDPTTGEILASAVADPNGAFSLNGDGTLNEVNIGCESCHGPGSAHQAEELLQPSASGKNKNQVNHHGKYMVNPVLLCNDRASLICGRCHGGAPVTNVNNFPPPGISRAQYLAYVSANGAALANLWPDQLHCKKAEAYSDWTQAQHSHNQRYLVACDDCHSGHFEFGFQASLRDDPTNPDSTLCQRCHAIDIASHATTEDGSPMTGSSGTCVECHMVNTAQEGAGQPGLLLGTPASTATVNVASDANIIYWQNDYPSHIMDVPGKFSTGVAGVKPGTAMPVPYTNSCGTCHDVSKLQYQAPSN